MTPSDLFLEADSTKCGIVAFIVLYDPRTSISMTALNALADSWFIDARKLPAAPALKPDCQPNSTKVHVSWRSQKRIHGEINPTQLLDTAIDGGLQAVEAAYVNVTNADNFGARSRSGNIFGHRLCLLNVAADYAGVGTQINHGADLGATDGASAACTEDHLVV